MPDAERERDLAVAAAAGIHRLPVPTPFAVGRVNCYLIEDDPLTLVDCGPNSGTSLTVLEGALAAHGRRVEDLERIVLTHQHLDHIGLAQILADRSGAEVCCLDALVPWLADYRAQMDAGDAFAAELMRVHGIPDEVVLALRAVSSSFRAWGAAARADTALTPGSTLDFAGRALRVHHRPGHSPSDTVLHDEASGVLLAGDHLLATISSNPVVSRPLDAAPDEPVPDRRPRALVAYLASMARTAAMDDVTLVLPGHGDPITDPRGLIASRVRGHERRKAKIAAVIDQGACTAYEIATALWGNIAVTQAYLTLSEVLGHVDLLLDDGRIVENTDAGGIVRFHAS